MGSAQDNTRQGEVILEVRDLHIEFHDHDKPETAVEDFDLTLHKGEILGLVGESGSGKSLSALAIAGLLNRHSLTKSGQILFFCLDGVIQPLLCLRGCFDLCFKRYEQSRKFIVFLIVGHFGVELADIRREGVDLLIRLLRLIRFFFQVVQLFRLVGDLLFHRFRGGFCLVVFVDLAERRVQYGELLIDCIQLFVKRFHAVEIGVVELFDQ